MDTIADKIENSIYLTVKKHKNFEKMFLKNKRRADDGGIVGQLSLAWHPHKISE